MNTTTWLCGPPPSQGQKQRFPSRFLYNLKKVYGVSERTLWMFSGSVNGLGDTTDIRSESGAKYVCPYDNIPVQDSTYSRVIADPPYNVGFSSEWITHKDDLPKPKRILKEAARLCEVGGLIMVLHIIVIPAYKEFGVERIALHPILCGPNNSIRVLNVFRKV